MKTPLISTFALAAALSGIPEKTKAQDLALLTDSVGEKVALMMEKSSHEKVDLSERIEIIREKLPKKWKLGSLEGELPEESRKAAEIEVVGEGKYLVRHERIGMITANDIFATTENGLEEQEITIEFSGLAVTMQLFHPFLKNLEEGAVYMLKIQDQTLEFIKKETKEQS